MSKISWTAPHCALTFYESSRASRQLTRVRLATPFINQIVESRFDFNTLPVGRRANFAINASSFYFLTVRNLNLKSLITYCSQQLLSVALRKTKFERLFLKIN